MFCRTMRVIAFLGLSFGTSSNLNAISITSIAETNGPDAAALVDTNIDPPSDYVVVFGSENTTINASGNPSSNPRAMGKFTSGMTPAGTLIPEAINQNAAGDAFYTGGIGIESGICLCTGLVTDDDLQEAGSADDGLGVGVEGPNNGYNLEIDFTSGEISFTLNTPEDNDFKANVASLDSSGDATVLQFQITLASPGFLRISFVHASDEHPVYSLNTYNDTPLVLVSDKNGQNFENILLFKNSAGEDETLSLVELDKCNLLQGNLVAPNPDSLPVPGGSAPDPNHADVGTDLHFDHEFGGFTIKLTRETACVLAPGTYTIKIVIQDVNDTYIDSATFFESGSLKLFHFLKGDANLDGFVGQGDLDAVLLHWGDVGVSYVEGDLDCSGAVGLGDLDLVLLNWGNTGGNKNFCGDFNRDGILDSEDLSIWSANNGLDQCASRFEGDANNDGKVNSEDLTFLHKKSTRKRRQANVAAPAPSKRKLAAAVRRQCPAC